MENTNYISTRYAGLIILLASIIGGTSSQGKWTDAVIMIAMLPAVIIGLTNLFDNHLGNVARAMCVAILLILLLQFVPASLGRDLPVFDSDTAVLELWSSNLSRSIHASAIGGCLLGFFLYLTTFTRKQQQSLFKFVFFGLSLNLVITIVQLSYSTKIEIENLLPYTIRMGVFQNENHFASLAYAVIPLLAWRYLIFKNQWPVYFILGALIVFVQLAVGSRSGIVVSACLFALCISVALTIKLDTLWKWPLLAGAAATLIFFAITVDHSSFIDADARAFYHSQTWLIAKNYWLTGTGLGSFFSIWPMFETSGLILPTYITHAHNDHLELFLEIGVVYFPLLAVFLLLVSVTAFRDSLTMMCAVSVMALLVHSLVDYPLRNMAVSVVFVLLCAILFTSRRNAPRTDGQLT